MKKQLLLMFLILLTLSAKAQVKQLNRWEVDHKWGYQDYAVISNNDKGVLVVQPEVTAGLKDYPIYFHLLNTNLEKEWTDTLHVKRQLYLRGYHYQSSKTYLLFQNSTQTREVRLVVVDLSTREIKAYDPKNIVDMDIQEFEVLQNTAIIGGYIEERPAVFAYDIENEKVRTLSNVYQNNSELVEVRLNSDSVTFNVIASKEDFKKDRTLIVSTYDYGGNSVRSYELVTQRDYNLLSGISSSIFDKEQLVMGLYTIKSGTFPSGVYINHVDRTGQQNMRYISFGEFDTFLDHNGERRAEKLKRKALEAKQENKDWRYKTDALFNELTETDEGFMLFGEFFKPRSMNTRDYLKSRGGLNPYRDINSRNIGSFYNDLGPSNQFNGNGDVAEWDFTHAFALKLDKKGNVLWDRSFDIDEEVEGGLTHFGAFQFYQNNAYYAYYHDEELVLKYLNSGDANAAVEPLNLKNETDQIRYEQESYRGIIKWYNNKFLVFGIQSLKGGSSDDNREVFFVNSIEAEPVSAEDVH